MAEKLEPSPKAYRINKNGKYVEQDPIKLNLEKTAHEADTLNTDVPNMLGLLQPNSPNGLLSMSPEDEECRHGV